MQRYRAMLMYGLHGNLKATQKVYNTVQFLLSDGVPSGGISTCNTRFQIMTLFHSPPDATYQG